MLWATPFQALFSFYRAILAKRVTAWRSVGCARSNDTKMTRVRAKMQVRHFGVTLMFCLFASSLKFCQTSGKFSHVDEVLSFRSMYVAAPRVLWLLRALQVYGSSCGMAVYGVSRRRLQTLVFDKRHTLPGKRLQHRAAGVFWLGHSRRCRERTPAVRLCRLPASSSQIPRRHQGRAWLHASWWRVRGCWAMAASHRSLYLVPFPQSWRKATKKKKKIYIISWCPPPPPCRPCPKQLTHA